MHNYLNENFLVFSGYVEIWWSGEIHLNCFKVALNHFSEIICGHCETDRKLRVTASSSDWQYVCVPHRYWKENTANWHWSVVLSASLHECGVFLFLKTLRNLDKYTPLANHSPNCAG